MAGSKRELAPGKWELRVYLGKDPVTGKKRQKSVTFRGGERAAAKALAALVTETDQDKAPATEGTLGHLLTHYMRRIHRDRAPDTAAGYQLHVDNVWMPTLGAVKLADLTTTQLQAVVDAEAERVIAKGRNKTQRVSADTVEREFAVVRGALNEGVRMGWLPRSPADHVILPAKQYKEEEDPPTVEELLVILKAADEVPCLGMLLRVASATGERRGELAGMRWRDVDLERRRILVRKSVTVKKRPKRKDGDPARRGPRELIVKDTKTHQKRPISIDEGTAVLLGSLKKYAESVAAVEAPSGRLAADAFVFSMEPDGSQPVRPPWITDAFKRAAIRAGAPDAHLHQLRHLNASLQLAAGVPLAVVSKRLGHRNQSTTLSFYSHVLGGDEVAAEVLGGLLGEALAGGPPDPDRGAAQVIRLPDRTSETG